MSASGNADSTTKGAISPGTVTITDAVGRVAKTGEAADATIASLNRDTANAQNSLTPIYDPTKVQAAFQITQAFTQQAGQFAANQAADKKAGWESPVAPTIRSSPR